MKTRVPAAMLTLFTLAVLAVISGCSQQPTKPLADARLGPASEGPGDSIPPPPPPPPSPPPILPIAFAGSDSTWAGATGELRWAVGNESSSPFQVDYTLTCQLAWPGFPKTGSIIVAPESVAPLNIPVDVPADAVTGMVEFQMTVTRPNGIPPTSANGWMRVVSNVPPPPPPPPPVSPLVYLGADSVQAGGIVTQRWQLTNESGSPFTMQWTLEHHSYWPGLPKSGSVSLAGNEVHNLTTTAAVPDTTSGPRWLRLTVTRPNGLPNVSEAGGFLVGP